MTDHCAIDLDQAAIEAQLAIGTPESFANARRIYEEGGHSKSYAELSILTQNGLPFPVAKGTLIVSKNVEGTEVAGKAYEDYVSGVKRIRVQYSTTDIQESYIERRCQVGGLIQTNTVGCLAREGTITIEGFEFAYDYDPATENKNGRTM